MKENYTNNELKELLEGVDLPSADTAWEKMSSLLDATAEGSASTSVGQSAIFKTIIWLNSIFLVLTTVVVGAMYKSGNSAKFIQETSLNEQPTLTIHQPPFEGQAESKIVPENLGEDVVEITETDLAPTVNMSSDANQSQLAEVSAVADQATTSEIKVQQISTENNKILGEEKSPGVSNKNDEGSPTLLSQNSDIDVPKTTKQVLDSVEESTLKDINDTVGGSFIAQNDILPAYVAPSMVFIKVGPGLNQYSVPSFLLKQMQSGIGYSKPISPLVTLQLELLFNPVGIENLQWSEWKELSYVPYLHDITARKLNYLSVPILAKGKLTKNLAFSFGAQQSFLLSTTGDVNSQISRGGNALVTTYENIKKYSDEQRFNKYNTAVLLNLDYQIEHWVVSARAQFSVTDVTSDNFGDTGFDGYKNLVITAAYQIPASRLRLKK